MYRSKFAPCIDDMLTSLHKSGLIVGFINYFLVDFDEYCNKNFPDASLLTSEIAESWIHNSVSPSKRHMSNRILTMKHLGRYQQSLGEASYVPNYNIKRIPAEEPRLFNNQQLTEFFEKVDTKIVATKTFPFNNIVYPVLFRVIYCCGLRLSEACNLKLEDVDLTQGTLTIYRSKGLKDRKIFVSDDIRNLCVQFHKFYNIAMPNREYFFQPNPDRSHYKAIDVWRIFTSMLKGTSFGGEPGKSFTPHGLRHLFAVQNIRKCAEAGEDFANWIEYLRQYMGHKRIKSTMYYLHMTSQLFPVYKDKLLALEEGIGVARVED